MQLNEVYTPAAETRARYRILYGGAGSGKSVFAAMDHVVRCHNFEGETVLVLRKVARTLRHSTFKLFTDILKAWKGRVSASVNKTEMTITFPNGSQIIHAGLDDTEKLKSIASVTRIWIEEATELDFPYGDADEPDLSQIDLRLRGVAAERVPQVTITFNPTLRAVPIFDYVSVSTADLPTRAHREYQSGSVYVQHTTYRDNPHVGADYAAVFSRLGGVMQAVYERGELVAVDAPDQLIAYEWVKAAFERDVSDAAHDGRQRMAVDVARYGDDETTTGILQGFALTHVEASKGQDTTTTGRRAASLARERGVAAELCAFDEVGLGSGALDTARSEGFEASGFIGGASPVEDVPGMPEGITFNNLRSQAWYFARVQLEAGAVAFAPDLPDDAKRKLQEDLLAPRFRIAQDRRFEVEPKDGASKTWGIKKRLGRSPDYGDMLVMGLFAEFVSVSTFEILSI